MNELIKKVLDYNKPEFNYIKLAEELAELQEVVIKRYVKQEANKPPIEKLIEEMGDVLLRMKILATMEDISSKVNDRKEEKLLKLLGWIEQGKYPGGA